MLVGLPEGLWTWGETLCRRLLCKPKSAVNVKCPYRCVFLCNSGQVGACCLLCFTSKPILWHKNSWGAMTWWRKTLGSKISFFSSLDQRVASTYIGDCVAAFLGTLRIKLVDKNPAVCLVSSHLSDVATQSLYPTSGPLHEKDCMCPMLALPTPLGSHLILRFLLVLFFHPGSKSQPDLPFLSPIWSELLFSLLPHGT